MQAIFYFFFQMEGGFVGTEVILDHLRGFGGHNGQIWSSLYSFDSKFQDISTYL